MVPYTFLDQHYLKCCPAKLSHFEGMTRYLQGFCVFGIMVGRYYFCSGRLTFPSICLERGRWLGKSLQFPHCQIRIPWSNWGWTACAPRTWQRTFGIFPHTIDPTCVCKHCTPCLSLLDAKDALTMIASFMTQMIFRGEFRAAWGTVCQLSYT